MGILSRRSRFADSIFSEEGRYADLLLKEGKKIISLDSGDPVKYFKTPSYVIKAYKRALSEGKTFYTKGDGLPELKDAVIKRYKKMYGLEPTAESIIITHGLSEGISMINSAFIDRGDTAILFRPYYMQYPIYVRMNDGKVVTEDYNEEDDWNIDVDKVGRNLKRLGRKKPKYMMVTNPNNPTGTVLKRKALKGIAELANDNDIFIISDEIYDEMIFGDVEYTSISEVAKGVPYMIMNGASKNFDATGLRIGFLITPENDKKSMEVKNKLVDYALTRLCVNTTAQYAIADAMNNQKEHERETRKIAREIERRVMFSFKLLSENNYIEVRRPHAAFYLFPKIKFGEMKIKSDADFVYRLMKEKGIWTREGAGFGSSDHFRIVSLAPKDILEDAILKINDFCRKNAK